MNKGTLTILDDKHIILGYPNHPDCIMYSSEQKRIHLEDIKQWLVEGGVISLPFPIEVIDLRPNCQSAIEELIPFAMNESTAQLLKDIAERVGSRERASSPSGA